MTIFAGGDLWVSWMKGPLRHLGLLASLALAFALTGCGKAAELPQGFLDPKGPVAKAQSEIFVLSMWIAIVIGTVVTALLLFFIWKFRARSGQKGNPAQIHGNSTLEVAWTMIPIVILIIVGVPTVRTAFSFNAPPTPAALTVKATGNQWWFGFEYPDQKIVTANELYIPAGQPVLVQLESRDVIHSFWVPKLAGKMDMIPNRVNTFWIQADEPGFFYGQCAEFCGAAHAKMRFRVHAVTQAEFDAWVKERQAGAKVPTEAQARRGQEVFMGNICISCHAIDGTKAQGNVGPNLSNVGGRSTIAAGVLENTEQNLKAWIKAPHEIKPGVKMPGFAQLTDADLDALVAYLRSLK